MLKELALGLIVCAGTSGCRGREAGRPACPPPGAPDASWLIAGWWDPVGGADEAWTVGERRRPGTYGAGSALLRWDGCDWQVARSPLDDGRLSDLSAIAAIGPDFWLAGTKRQITEGDEVFAPDGRITRVGGGEAYCEDDGRIFRRHGNEWAEVPPKPDAQIAYPKGADAREHRALAVWGPDDVWMLDRNCGRIIPPDQDVPVSLVRWNGHKLTTVEIDRGIGTPLRLLVVESRAWPWSETVRNLWLAATKGAGRWDGRAWRWFPFDEQDRAYKFAGGGPSDLWVFGAGARHWDGTRWSMVRGPAIADPQTNAPVFMWAGAVAGGHTFALDSAGVVFRANDARLIPIGRVRGRVTGLAVGSDELWLWAVTIAARPAFRWRAGRWDAAPAAAQLGVTLEPDIATEAR